MTNWLKYVRFFSNPANLANLHVAHATDDALGLINTTERLLRIPNGRWAGQQEESGT